MAVLLLVALAAQGTGLANPLRKKARHYDLAETPEAFRAIHGQDAAIRELLIFGDSVLRPEILQRAGVRPAPTHRTALLYGPPGTGKTSLVHALVRHLDHAAGAREVALRNIDVNAMLSPYIGETEERIRQEFEKAAKKVAKKGAVVIVYMDEIDKLAQKRGGSGPDDARPSPALHQLLTIIGSVDWPEGVVPIASTNVVSDLDPAILRRFGWPIAVPNPTVKGRHAILDHYTGLMNLRAMTMDARAASERRMERVNRWVVLRRIARKTFFMSPADIERVVRMAAIQAIDRRGPGLAEVQPAEVADGAEEAAPPSTSTTTVGTVPVTMRDFKDAVSRFWLLKESESKPVRRPKRPLHEKNVALRVWRHPRGMVAGAGEVIKDHERTRLGVPSPARMKGPPSDEEIAAVKLLRHDRRMKKLRVTSRVVGTVVGGVLGAGWRAARATGGAARAAKGAGAGAGAGKARGRGR